MKKFLFYLIIPILTFAAGVYVYRISLPKVSLETITKYTLFYDGMNVEIETYVQVKFFDENYWNVGEPFEKKEIAAILDLEGNTTNLENLHSQLKENLGEYKYKRAKVLVRGKIKDNCNHLSDNGAITFGCCFGKTITIKAQEVIQLAPVEDYIRPE